MPVVGNFQDGSLIVNQASLNGRVVMTNGQEAQKYNPATSQVVPLVLVPFRGTVALTDIGAGNLTGTYIYRIVPYNINEDEEGEELDQDFTITVTGRRVRINRAGLIRDMTEITHWRIYRTIGGGSYPALALVATVAWATATYDDNIADGTLNFENDGIDTLIQWPTPKPFICTHGSRLFMIGDIPYETGTVHVTNGSTEVIPVGDAVFGFWCKGKEFHVEGDARSYEIDYYDPATGYIYLTDNYAGTTALTATFRICGDADTLIFSEEYYENQWPGANNRPIVKKEADKPSGIMSSPGRLLIPKSRKTYALYFDNYPHIPYSTVALLSDQYGCISHRTMVTIDGVAVWASNHGIVQVTSGVRLISDKLANWFKENVYLDVNGTQQMCFAVHYAVAGQYILFVRTNNDTIGCSKAVVWHYKTGKFAIWEFNKEFTCGTVIKKADGQDEIHLGDAYGYIWKFPDGNIDGAPINGTLEGTVDNYGDVSPCFIYDADAHFVDTGLGLAGVPIYIYEGTGAGQWNVIADNDGDTLVFDQCWDTPLDSTSRYRIGAIIAQYKTGWLDFGTLARIKDFKYYHTVFEKENSEILVRFYKEFETAPVDMIDAQTNEDASEVDLSTDGRKRKPMGGIRTHHLAWELYDEQVNNPFKIFDIGFDYRFGDE